MSVKQKLKDGWYFLAMFYRKSNNMNNIVFSSLKKIMNDLPELRLGLQTLAILKDMHGSVTLHLSFSTHTDSYLSQICHF